jgi:hypothetical protein
VGCPYARDTGTGMTPIPPPDAHGKYSTYNKWKCRCDLCRAANVASTLRLRARRAGQTPPEDAHGKYSTYTNWSCRCELCRAANLAQQRKQQARYRSDPRKGVE